MARKKLTADNNFRQLEPVNILTFILTFSRQGRRELRSDLPTGKDAYAIDSEAILIKLVVQALLLQSC